MEARAAGPEGLSGEDWSAMNALGGVPEEARPERYSHFREVYAGKPYALEQIDIFDKSSPYGTVLSLYVQVLKDSDPHGEEVIEEWFKENYPLLNEYGSTRGLEA